MDNSVFSFSATETGYNHLKINKVCEDASDYYDDENVHIGVVADGHGSDNYPRTDRGAQFAVNAAIRCIIEFVENADPQQVIEDEDHNYVLLTQLAKSILRDWYQAVENDYNKHPFEEKELEKVSDKYRKRYLSGNKEERHAEKAYGCTLIAYSVTEKYSFGLQIGDGKCVVINHYGEFTEPIPWDDNCQMNVTTSICDSDAIDEFRFCIFDRTPAAVFCGSDGIDDSYASPEEMYGLYRSILKIFIEHGIEVGQNEIKEYLPVLTKRGSGDDVSIATVIDMRKITELAPIFEIQASLFKLAAGLDEKKKRLAVTGEKMDALYKKFRDFTKREGKLQAVIDEFQTMSSLYNNLREEIEADEKQIYELQTQSQNLIYDLESATFEESGFEDITEADDEPAAVLEAGETATEDNTIKEVGSREKDATIAEPMGTESMVAEPTKIESAVAESTEIECTVVESTEIECTVVESTETESIVAEPPEIEFTTDESTKIESEVVEPTGTESVVVEATVTESSVDDTAAIGEHNDNSVIGADEQSLVEVTVEVEQVLPDEPLTESASDLMTEESPTDLDAAKPELPKTEASIQA